MGTNVRSHLVPRGYLRGFALNEQIAMRSRTGGAPIVAGLTNAAVVRNFYRRQRPDGSYVQDVEAAISPLEHQAVERIRSIRERWPLDLQDRGVLAEFIALQLLRGRSWRRWHDGFLRRNMVEFRDDEELLRFGSTALDALEADLGTDTERLQKMMDLHPKVGTVIGSAHWTLVAFDEPLLATSDEPVVPWPLAATTLSSFSEGGRVVNRRLGLVRWFGRGSRP